MQRAIAVSIAVAIALIVSAWLSQQSSQADLRLAVEELRARAAELAVLARASEEGRVTTMGMRVVAQQLKDKIADTRDELVDLQRETQSAHAARGVELANGLASNADMIASQRHAGAPVSQQAADARKALTAMETELRPK